MIGIKITIDISTNPGFMPDGPRLNNRAYTIFSKAGELF